MILIPIMNEIKWNYFVTWYRLSVEISNYDIYGILSHIPTS